MEYLDSVIIRSTPHEVFQWLDQPEKTMQWMTSVSKGEIVHDTPERIGTTFRETVEEDGNGIEMQGVITGYIPDELISFHLESRVNVVDVAYRVKKVSSDMRISQIATVRWKFPVNIISLFIGQKIKQGIADQSHKELLKLKKLCETGSK